VRAGSADDIRRVLALAGRYPAGPDHRVGYAKAAQTFRH
jgi:hypothetical protein